MLRYRCENDKGPSCEDECLSRTPDGIPDRIMYPRRSRSTLSARRRAAVRKALVVTLPLTLALTVSPISGSPVSGSPVSGAGVSVSSRPAAKPVRLDDPLADAADVALSIVLADTAAGRALSQQYIAQRSTVARLVGERLWTDPADFVAAWSAADVDHQIAVMAALSQVGVPYRKWASTEDEGFDCSGLTMYAWSQAGFDLPHNSTRQIRAAEPRDIFSAQAGDLLRYPGHVMMWLGVGQAIVHSPQPRQYVEVKVLTDKMMRRSAFGDPTGA